MMDTAGLLSYISGKTGTNAIRIFSLLIHVISKAHDLTRAIRRLFWFIFKKLKVIKYEYKINDVYMYNMDEYGIQIENTDREKVFYSAENNSGPVVMKAPSLEK